MNPFSYKTRPTAVLKSCSRIPSLHLIHCFKSVRPPFQLFCSSISTWNRQTLLCPEMLLPVGVLLSHLVLSCQHTHCYMVHKQQQMISMWRNVREWADILLLNISCSHLHSFCATGVSSGLATMATLTRVSQGRLGEYGTEVGLLLI
jgi:hypothetical protein